MQWDPSQYLKFADQRLRPALDLLARVPLQAPARVVDLGCGAGNVTRLLAERWPEAEITGVDGSAEMLAKAASEAPAIAWRQAEIAAWVPESPPDLLYSNAALHWLDGHEVLFPRLFAAVAPGGVLTYSVCTISPAEERLAAAGAVRTYPHRDGTDGFYIARDGD
jgi:trans-aconitate 2-methyltransferase